MEIPTFDKMMNPLLVALHKLGGSGTIDEINTKTIELMNIPNDVADIPHGENGSRTEVEYRLAWTRTYLKKFGLLENSSRGVWALEQIKEKPIVIIPKTVVKKVRKLYKITKTKESTPESYEKSDIDFDIPDLENWIDHLNQTLLNLKPIQFERLAQRILRESGFTQVEVTGKTGDGGIDGKGIIKISGILSFHVLFQCKKYKGSVSSRDIRDFRGALQGRADKGLFITTGSFTRDAIKEAHRDGAPPIDLIDGTDLANKLKDLNLGIKTEFVENITVDTEWFKKI